MFWPVGDDLNKRDFPVVGVMLIAINFFVYCYEFRLRTEFLQQYYKLMEAVDYQPDQQVIDALFTSSSYNKFLDTWAASRKNLQAGHVMCLVTACFLHVDFMHLLGNMVVLWALVGTLENALGSARFFFLYLLWGVIASASHVLMNWSPNDPGTVGASGAIAGMIGAYIITFGALTKIKTMVWIVRPYFFDVPAGAFILFWLWTQLAGIHADEQFNGGQHSVAWYAHLGGFAIGAVTMLAFSRDIKQRMYRDKEGKLHLRSEEEFAKLVEQELKKQEGEAALDAPPSDAPAAPATNNCPYCGAEITDANKIHDKLWRCPSCKNMVLK